MRRALRPIGPMIGPVIGLALLAPPLAAKDSLGMFSNWGAFRDVNVPRCYAIAKPQSSKLHRDYEPYLAIGTWPGRKIRGQIHFRLSRKIAKDSRITLVAGDKRFQLTGGGGDAWAQSKTMDAAIIATIRSAKIMVIGARGSDGKRFSNTYDLSGAATAMDAATVGCARYR